MAFRWCVKRALAIYLKGLASRAGERGLKMDSAKLDRGCLGDRWWGAGIASASAAIVEEGEGIESRQVQV